MAYKRKARKMSKFKRSQKAHTRLNSFYMRQGNSDKNRALGNNHAEVLQKQREKNRILSKEERSRLFEWWCKYEGYTPEKE